MTGEEVERAIEFLLKSQANLEARIEQVNSNLSAQIGEVAAAVAEVNQVVRLQAESQSELNQMFTRAITGLAEAQTNTERKLNALIDIVRGQQTGGA